MTYPFIQRREGGKRKVFNVSQSECVFDATNDDEGRKSFSFPFRTNFQLSQRSGEEDRAEVNKTFHFHCSSASVNRGKIYFRKINEGLGKKKL